MSSKLRFLILFWLLLGVAFGQTGGVYTPGQFQTTNPYYLLPNPFYFEGKIDWNLLGITNPANAWDYMERGMYEQDDLNDTQSAIGDYETALTFNSLQNGSCQIVTAATLVNGGLPGTLNPAPCIFTLRLRLGYLEQQSNPTMAIQLFLEVVKIDPLKLGINTLIGDTYVIEAQQTTDTTAQAQAYASAIQAYQAELALSPVTAQTIALSGDQANNAHVHWALAQIYQTLGQSANQLSELQLYVQATQWHSDVYPWRIMLANNLIKTLKAQGY
jgi:tetratricopeptide (TPR) repeat protein